MIDWTPFYIGLIVVGALGILSGIFSKPLNRVISKVEEKASGKK